MLTVRVRRNVQIKVVSPSPRACFPSRGDQYSDRYLPFDNNPAQGYLDAVNDDEWAYGWGAMPTRRTAS